MQLIPPVPASTEGSTHLPVKKFDVTKLHPNRYLFGSSPGLLTWISVGTRVTAFTVTLKGPSMSQTTVLSMAVTGPSPPSTLS